jgi:hypothetical protein
VGAVLVLGEGEGEISPVVVRTSSQVEDAVALGNEIEVVLYLIEGERVAVAEVGIALSGGESTYCFTMRFAS